MTKQMTKKKIAASKIMTQHEKDKLLNEMRELYKAMSDEELLQLIRDFVAENGRVPERKDLIYDAVIKQRFGPWGRATERAGVRPVAQTYLNKKRRHAEKRQLAKERRRLLREEKEMEAAQQEAVEQETVQLAGE